MKEMSLEQMEILEAGDAVKGISCGIAIATTAAAFVGLVTLTASSGGLAIGAAVVGWSLAPSATALACLV